MGAKLTGSAAIHSNWWMTLRRRQGTPSICAPFAPYDGRLLNEFHENLSLQSVYRRFFFLHPRLSAAETERFTHVDYVDRLALVAEHGDRLVAVGRYERIPRTPKPRWRLSLLTTSSIRGSGQFCSNDWPMPHGRRESGLRRPNPVREPRHARGVHEIGISRDLYRRVREPLACDSLSGPMTPIRWRTRPSPKSPRRTGYDIILIVDPTPVEGQWGWRS